MFQLVFNCDDDPGSIGTLCLYVYERMEAERSKTFQIKLIAQLLLKRQSNEMCSDFDEIKFSVVW